MAIRKNNTSDMQAVIVALLKSLQTAVPWSTWTIIFGYPNSTQIKAADKGVVYVEEPILTTGAESYQFGGGEPRNIWALRIGFWGFIDSGGRSRAGTWATQMVTLIQTKAALFAYKFDVEIASTTFSDTTLGAQGVWLDTISGPRPITGQAEDKNDYRLEFEITLKA